MKFIGFNEAITHVTSVNENTTEIKSNFLNAKINATDEEVLAVTDIIKSLVLIGVDIVKVS